MSSATLQPGGPTVWLYNVRGNSLDPSRPEWLARVILTSDGCIFVRSWWGSFAYYWNGMGMEVREFIVTTDADYLAGKLAHPLEKKPPRGRKNSAEEFCDRVLPFLKEMLRAELAAEAAGGDTSLAEHLEGRER